MQYSKRMPSLEAEGAFVVLARAKKLEAEGRSIIHLQIGEPDFETPGNIMEAGIKAIRDGHTHYAPSAGVFEARDVAADYFNRTRNINISRENVVIMPGCKPMIYSAMEAILNAGDEVIVPDPGYPSYRSAARFIGGVPVPIKLREENDFRFLVSDLEKLITPKTRMIVINSPENPTGGVLTTEDLEGIYALAKKHDLWIMADEIYSRLVFDGEFKSMALVPGALERTILLDGLSKTYSMTGWRLGFAAMPKELTQHMTMLAVNLFSSTATFTQHAMIEALTGPQDEAGRMRDEFHRRRDVIVDGLNKIDGISCHRPQGAFYVFPNITGTGLTSNQFADLLLEEAGVAGLSGTAFGQYGEGYARFSCAASVENIKEALRRIEQVLANRLAKS